jgi:tRNA pseudouridine55 synthase
MSPEGILLVNKPKGKTSFSLVGALRKILNVKTIGHAGTLDPLATGVMVMLIGKNYTRLSDKLLGQDKEYIAEVTLGSSTDSYDSEGQTTATSTKIPFLDDLKTALDTFQGEIQQIPPMFSAKKIQGKKLYELARKGKTVERAPVTVTLETTLLSYQYPFVILKVKCTKGTYIRSIAHDLGQQLQSEAHLSALQRTQSGLFSLNDCYPGEELFQPSADLKQNVIKQLILTQPTG